jgi:hypothetical protein
MESMATSNMAMRIADKPEVNGRSPFLKLIGASSQNGGAFANNRHAECNAAYAQLNKP